MCGGLSQSPAAVDPCSRLPRGDVIGRRQLGEIDIRVTQIGLVIAATLTGGTGSSHNLPPRLLVAVVVIDDRHDWDAITGHRPERIGLPEQETALSLEFHVYNRGLFGIPTAMFLAQSFR